MNLSSFLAQIWGFSFIIVGMSLLINQKNIKKLTRIAEDEMLMYFGGIIAFVIGVAMVLTHNVWVKDWRVVITIFGWLSLLKGALLLFLPDYAIKLTNKIKDHAFLPFAFVVAVFIGLFLVYIGFTA